MRKRAKAVQWLTRRGLSRWVVYLEDEEEGVVDLDQVCVLAKKNGGDALRVRHYKRRYVKTTFLPIVCLFTILMTCYFLNGSEFCISHDITANLFLPLNLLKYGTLFFRPERWPPLFYWKLDGFENSRCVLEPMHLANVTSPVAAGLLKLGHLSLRNERYFMIPVISSSNTYANIFGLGAGLTALPVVSIMKWISPVGWTSSDGGYDLLFLAGKITASLCSSIAAIMLFSILRVRSGVTTALMLSLHYGLCTAVFSMASQGLWQHGPNAMYICVAIYLYTRRRRTYKYIMGACLGAAVFCRPNSVLVTIVFVIESLISRGFKQTVPIVLGGVPFAVSLLYYNYVVLGHMFSTAQTVKSVEFLDLKGRPSLFSTPILEGLSGLLFSPSRGLFVFSPMFMFLILVWLFIIIRRRRFFEGCTSKNVLFRPACVSCLVLTIFASKWYDWWGGYCYGCRPLLDVLPFVTLILESPARHVLSKSKSRIFRFVLISCFLWGLFVQALGVGAYNASTWNHYAYDDRGEGMPLSIDSVEGRHRLWSFSQGQIAHLYNEFNHSRKLKVWKMWHYSHNTIALKLDSLFQEHETLADSIDRCASDVRRVEYSKYMRQISSAIRARDASLLPLSKL